MADHESKESDPPRGNEWEVVTLTASTYAAAPGSKRADLTEDDNLDESETSSALFMSKHFVFPPSQHENLPLEPEFNEEIHIEKETEEDDVSRLVKEDEENAAFEGLILDDYPISGCKSKSLSNVDIGNEQSIYDSAEFSSFRSETTIGMSDNAVVGEGIDDSVEPIDNSPQKPFEGEEHSLPCEAWWKRRAFSVYAHAKEANTFWSIFITATVMGLVIIGHQWQQERWKVLHFKYDERMVGPISRFKDLIVGGHRPGSLVRGGTTER